MQYVKIKYTIFVIMLSGMGMFSRAAFAERSLFEDAVYEANQRAISWIKVNTNAGNFGGWNTALGGLAILSQRQSNDLNSGYIGYRFAPLEDQEMLRSMVFYIISRHCPIENRDWWTEL